MFNNVYGTPHLLIDEDSLPTIEMIYWEMEKDIIRNDLSMNKSLISYMKLLLINCARLKNQQSTPALRLKSDESFVVQKLKNLIDQDFKEKHSLKDYADALHISPKALGKISKIHFDKT